MKKLLVIMLVFTSLNAIETPEECMERKGLAKAGICYWFAGQEYREGKRCRLDMHKALDYFEKSCASGNGMACESLGSAYRQDGGHFEKYNRGESVTERNYKVSYEYYEKACRSKHKRCDGLNTAKKMYENELHCVEDNNATACMNMGRLLGRKNALLLSFYDKACELNNSLGCLKASEIIIVLDRKAKGKQKKYIKKSCDLNNALACYNYAVLVQKNKKEFLKYTKQACSLKYANACYQLGRYYKNKRDLINAKEHFGVACDMEHKRSCSEYNSMYEK